MGYVSAFLFIAVPVVYFGFVHLICSLFKIPTGIEALVMVVSAYAGLAWQKMILWPNEMRYVKIPPNKPVLLAVTRFVMTGVSWLIVILALLPVSAIALVVKRHWPGFDLKTNDTALLILGVPQGAILFTSISLLQRIGWMPKELRDVKWDRDRAERQAPPTYEFYYCQRCFLVDGPSQHYFLEMDDERTIHISGLILRDFHLGPAGKGTNKRKIFPSSIFTVQRGGDTKLIEDMFCSGEPFEPEAVARAYTRQETDAGLPLECEIFPVGSYERIKRERMAVTG